MKSMRSVILLAATCLLARPLAPQQPAPQQTKVWSLSDLKLVRILELKSTTYHVQGVEFDERNFWITSVDTPHRKGFLHEFSMDKGELLRQIEITDGNRFHLGGVSADRTSLWIPVAEYRPKSSSVIQQRSKRTLNLESQFEVADHIGCIAVTPEFLVGGNWDSREFYVWNHLGQLIRRVQSETGNAYQDMKFESQGIVASGLLADHSGAIDWLDFPSFRLRRRLKAGNTDRGVPFTREGMATDGNQLLLLPEDGPSRLFILKLPKWKTRER
jgi:hypothetical protein